MKYSIDNIDKRARKILGLGKDEEVEFTDVVDRYIITLANYVTNLDDKTFFMDGVFHNLNYSLYHLTGWCLKNYTEDILTEEEILERCEENKHYDLLIHTTSNVMLRFINNNKIEDANNIGATLYVIANSIYDFETSLEDIDKKTLS